MRGGQIGRIVGVLALVGGAVLATTTSAQAATPCPGWGGAEPGSITNNSSVPLGVIHLADGNCTNPYYDVRIDPGENTYQDVGWSEVAAAYIPRGYGARVWRDGQRLPDYLPSRSYVWFDTRGTGRNWTVQLYCGYIDGNPC